MSNAFSINNEYGYGYSGYNGGYSYASRAREEESIFLEQTLEQIEDKQGILGKAWNGIKEITTLGVSESDCEKMLVKFNKGEISLEEAIDYLNEYDSKQETMSGLLSNILTGIGAIAVVGTGGASGIGWATAFLAGAPVGAALKTGLGVVDRATNDVENDALSFKQVTKDAISGALTGAASAVSGSQCFIYKKLGLEEALAEGIGKSAIAGALCGVECGAMSGSASYMTDVAFGDKEFSFEDLATNTLTSAFVSGTVGGVVGAGTKGLVDAGVIQKDGSVAKFSFLSSLRKALGVGEREMLNI